MAISNIYEDYYKKIINNTFTNKKNVNSNSEDKLTSDTSATKSIAKDKLNLSSTNSNSLEFMNYTASGKYVNTSSLVDFLNNDDDDKATDLFGISEKDSNTQIYDLESLLNNNSEDKLSIDSISSMFNQSSTDSIGSMFNQLVKDKSEYIDSLISKSLNKLSGSEDNTVENKKSSSV